MIPVTIMIWFDRGFVPLFKNWETEIHPKDAQEMAEKLAAEHPKGQCKIFDDHTNEVIGSSGF